MCRAVTRMFTPPRPQMPALPPLPPVPGSGGATPAESPEAMAAADAEATRARQMRGRAATILTSAQGLVGGAEQTARPMATRVLLGG